MTMSDTPDTLQESVAISFRPFEITDRSFILRSWIRCHRRNHSGISDEDYFYGQTHLIYALSGNSKIVIACDAAKPEFILGFACGRMATNGRDIIMHYVYVKEAYRKNGVARDLVSHIGYRGLGRIIATAWSRTILNMSQNKPIEYNPFINHIGENNV